ncbi:hypothetical protein LguiB_022017 [Lonicera macranthoides]
MKLRVRSLETKETLRIQLPNPSTLHYLKQVISQSISSSPSPSPSPSSIHLSLNRKDELPSSSPDDHLHSLGITSGDLIFFTLNPNSFSPQTLTLTPNSNPSSSVKTQAPLLDAPKHETLNPNSDSDSSVNSKPPCLDTQKDETLTLDPNSNSSVVDTKKEETLENSSKCPIVESNEETHHLDTQKDEIVDLNTEEETGDYMEVDGDVAVLDSRKSFTVPGFLRKVFSEELGGGGDRPHELLVIAVHAVLLESGFVGFGPHKNTAMKWPLMSLSYSLPEVISKQDPNDGIDFVVLKFQCVGKFFNVYGSVANGIGTITHWVCVDEDQLVPFLNIVWANCGLTDEIRVKQGVSSTRTTPEAEVFKFWKNVKDRIALPLLMDLCEKAGLNLPPCFMVLPSDLKLKIIESLPGGDIAKLGSVSSELRYLTSSDDLWKQKFEEEFGNVKGPGGRSWKERFAKEFRRRKRSSVTCSSVRRSVFNPRVRFPPVIGGGYDIWPHLGPLPGRNIIGGDYDRFPNLGPLHHRVNPRIRNHMPHLNLEG